MINHARTLLLNIAANRTQLGDAGYEYIPAEFRPVHIPAELSTLQRTFFGTTPDNYFLFARARELLGYIHTTELADYAYALDPRITYWPPTNTDFFTAATQPVTSQQVAGPPIRLNISGTVSANTAIGRAERNYTVLLTPAATQHNITIQTTTESAVVPLDSPGKIFKLPDTELKFFIESTDIPTEFTAARWQIRARTNPPPLILNLSLLELLGTPVFLTLFGPAPTEPYATFNQIWEDHPLPAYRIAGLTLAYIYRLHDGARRG